MRSRAAIAVSAAMGLLALVMMSTYISSRESELLQLAELQDVYVAALDILPNTILDESVIQRVQVPSTYVQPMALSSPDMIVGRVTVVPIPRGAQIVGMSLEGRGEMTLSLEVPRGRRAVTIAVGDVTGVGGLVRPGNFVDVLGTFEFGRPVGYEGDKFGTRMSVPRPARFCKTFWCWRSTGPTVGPGRRRGRRIPRRRSRTPTSSS